MAERDAVALTEGAAPDGTTDVPQVGDTYRLPRSVHVLLDLLFTANAARDQEPVAGQAGVRLKDTDPPEFWVYDENGVEYPLARPIVCDTVPCSDETSDLEVGVLTSYHQPYDFELLEVQAGVNGAPVGAEIQVDIKEAGVSIFSTLLTIDDGEEHSLTAAVPAVVSDALLAKGSKISIEAVQVGSTTKGFGLKIYMIGRRAL